MFSGVEGFDKEKKGMKGMKEGGGEAAVAGAEAASSTSATPPLTVNGKVKIRYNHYTEEVDLSHPEGGEGFLPAADVVDLLALDFAFNGAFVTHLNEQQKVPRNRRKWQDKVSRSEGWSETTKAPSSDATIRIKYNTVFLQLVPSARRYAPCPRTYHLLA